MGDRELDNLIAAALTQMAAYNGADVRRIGHALKVFGYADIIGKDLPFPVRERLLVAAALHDIGIHNAERKYHSSAGPYQEKEGPAVARAILAELGAPAALIERVCFLVGHHHTYTAVDGPDYQALIEADFLVNIEEDGLSREAAASIGTKYFRTEEGLALLRSLFGVLPEGNAK